ncbi:MULTISPECIES: dephospho-CoA kinase [unclassified Bacillus (in: firmicutes)]|uniref:dephospho-CoA kinase n=1 Tax=unclassified Bacillus (in: firmicutes) TaxID=185979 RepID=UPI0008E94748|nr:MULTISPECIES: dephospho-CoA kinase [unclassified Bacillus (in: firmicutes)]SFB17196.1 dephospho-CoA kinase [Bacillus sp. UNCCL13]SFQ77440.1 dephospho-CoA kinase [Bacillus sp. cl95]
MAIVIGLTGGIASGKSTVSNMLRELGCTVIDADLEARFAVNKGEPAYEEIVKTFGEEILLEDGEIDRQKLGSIIFHDEEKRQVLNNIVHPAVRRNMTSKKEVAILKGEEVVVLDIPLLFESKLTYMVEKTLLVYVNYDVQLQRLMKRNDFTESEALARIQSQMPLSEKIALADAVIDNNGDLEHTRNQLLSILDKWRR